MKIHQISLNFKQNLSLPVLPQNTGASESSVQKPVQMSSTSSGLRAYVLPFDNTSKNRFDKAKAYLRTRTAEITKSNKNALKAKGASCFNWNKLDGIQDGIKVFDGMRIKDIAFAAGILGEIMLNRGCYEQCVHCFTGAQPPICEDEKHINKMSWENFESLMNGFKELNERLGFSIFEPRRNLRYDITLFHDSDCSITYLKDINGKVHDFIELQRILYDTTGRPTLFDTAGWDIKDNPGNKETQKRMERYVDYYKQFGMDNMTFNLSVNPFHGTYARSVENHDNELRKKYINRMANVLFTLSPLAFEPNFQFLARALPNGTEGMEGFCEDDLRQLYDEIFDKLKDLYKKDPANEQKVVKTTAEAEQILEQYRLRLKNVETSLNFVARLREFGKNNAKIRELIEKYDKTYEQAPLIFNSYHTKGLIDANGRFYLADNDRVIYPSEIQFNFENRDKETAALAPNFTEVTITPKDIDDYFKQTFILDDDPIKPDSYILLPYH